MALPNDKKLSVLCRIEPGCLGPDGIKHIESFCLIAQQAMQYFDADVNMWVLVPRYDKTLAEIQYSVGSKLLTSEQTAKYMHAFGRDLEGFEERFHDKLTLMINQYLARNIAKSVSSH